MKQPSLKKLAIASFTISLFGFIIFLGAIGAVLGIIAYTKSKRIQQNNKLAIAAIVIGVVYTVVWIVGILLFSSGVIGIKAQCRDRGPGTYLIANTQGQTVTCHQDGSVSNSN
jgi:small-conductance mechanosensitive channel